MFRFPRDFAYALCLALIAGFFLVGYPIVFGSCTNTNYIASVTMNNGTYSEATQAYTVIPPTPSLCGSGWSNGGYVSSHPTQYFAPTNCLSANYIEAGLFYGTWSTGGSSGTSNPHYYYILVNSGNCPNGGWNDASSGGTHPSFGDNVTIDIQLQSTGSPNYYMVIYKDMTSGVTLSIYSLVVSAANGPVSSVQMESFNFYNSFGTSWGSPKYESTSGTWYYWPSSITATSDSPYYVVQHPTSFYDDWCGYTNTNPTVC